MLGLALWMCLVPLIWGSGEALKSFYAERLCKLTTTPVIHLGVEDTGIITSLPYEMHNQCKILLMPLGRQSVVLSIAKYNLNQDDILIIEDSDRHKIALVGSGNFEDERKSVVSDGAITIHYFKNLTNPYDKVKFQFTFTATRDGPCDFTEFQCRNNKCIPKTLVCGRHNHCGDNSEHDKCGWIETTDEIFGDAEPAKPKVWIITIIVGSVILGVVIIVFVAVLIRGVVKRKKAATTVTAPPSLAQAPPPGNQAQPPENHAPPQGHHAPPQGHHAPPQGHHAPPQGHHSPPLAEHPHPISVFGQIRRSLRGRSNQNPPAIQADPPATNPEVYQVPSMYPHIPSAPDFPGIDNPEYQADE